MAVGLPRFFYIFINVKQLSARVLFDQFLASQLLESHGDLL
jgi:hypothetical protein